MSGDARRSIARRATRDRDLITRPVTGEEVGLTLGAIERPKIISDPESLLHA